LSNLSTTEIGHFGFNLGLAAAGMSVALLGASKVRAVDFVTGVAFVLAYALVDAMNVRLSRGDSVFVDGAIMLASIILLSPPMAVVTCLLGVALGATFDTRNHKPLVARLGEILRRPLLVAAIAMLASTFLDRAALASGSAVALLMAVGLGLLHSCADFVLLAIDMALEKRIGVWASIPGLARSLSALYAAHISLGVASALLFPSGRLWGFGVMVALVLLIQYSFNLLLKSKGAYSETIQALVRASELQSGENEEGHSRRVADLCFYAGRLLSLSTKSLERLNYAALLHEIGRIGLDEGDESARVVVTHPARGAEIVSGIPFLASTQVMIRNQSASPVVKHLSIDDEDALSAQLIGVCCAFDRFLMASPGRGLNGDSLRRGLEMCAPLVDSRVRDAVLSAAVRSLQRQETF